MRLAGAIALALLAAIVSATVAAGRDAATPSARQCGGQLWRLKTLSDLERRLVRLKPQSTTIAAIAEQESPRSTPRRRRTQFQRQAWEVVAQVTAHRLDNGGVRLVLFDGGSYLNAVIPSPSCLARTSRARASMAATWKRFSSECAHPSRDWQALGAIVYIRGVGFWSQRRAARGSSANGAELHPVTGFRVVAGCSS
jgi:hypothetical protein